MGNSFLGNVVIKGKIEAVTGIHVGGSKDKLQIGGVDSPVLRDPHSNLPYLPGSSIKGKMRMLLEFALGKIHPKGEPYSSTDIKDAIPRIFGSSEKDIEIGPTRLVVRDAYPDDATKAFWEGINDSELLYTEYKPENSINRLTSEANPRFLERIVKGSKFDFEMIYSIYEMEADPENNIDLNNFKHVFEAVRLLEHSGLGGNISRGYGQVKFLLADPVFVSKDDYQSGKGEYEKISGEVTEKKLKTIGDIKLPEIFEKS
ncbi:MAG: type III-A CRISPR-associated RAMP protein Csm3 [Melioribacteraceae bacterium]|nr:MAG: type III-A CRISPR-associated RAMP protein Csm3 [Melioribacteraceae bacterium]